jgi:3-deoxy-7-phosphoheptulonate synthase
MPSMTGPGLSARHPWAALRAEQQPDWQAHPVLPGVVAELARRPPLVTPAEIASLRGFLATAASAEALVLQVGDCAESLTETAPEHVSAKADLMSGLASKLASGSGIPVAMVGRIGGQFAKPRSRATELHDGQALPAFRGHMINSELRSAAARQHDPRRMLASYDASARVLQDLRLIRGPDDRGPWSSHEALVIDYETAAVREDPQSGAVYLGSTHFPWVGERTRQPSGAHVHMLSAVSNPVACKVGPAALADDVVRVCAMLDPERQPGRLALIARMGAEQIRTTLGPIAAAVRQAGHPVIWLTDPMHGNTKTAAGNLKTRYLSDILSEIEGFRLILERQRLHPGGLHLEVATSPVTECVGGPVEHERTIPVRYLTFCDPRLNPEQAHQVIEAWR